MSKGNSIIKAYAIFSQGICSTICLTGLGFFIGWRINKHSSLCGILAVVGALLGISVFVIGVYKGHYFDDKLPSAKKADKEEEEGEEAHEE